MPTADPPPAEVQLIVSSSSRLGSQPPTATQADGGEGHPDEFKVFTDQQLQSKITRLRGLHFHTPDGGEKTQRMVYRVQKELDRRRAARPRKGEVDAEEFKNFTDQNRRLKTKRSHDFNGSTSDGGKKSPKRICRLEKEPDRCHAAGVETGQRHAVQKLSVDDPYANACTAMPQVENTGNHSPLTDTEAANLEGERATSDNLGAEEVEHTTSTFSGQNEEETRKKGKQSQIGGVLENNLEFKVEQTQKLVEEVKEAPMILENNLEFKVEQTHKLVEEVKEALKQEDRFTIEKCVAVLEAIKELTDVEKAKVLNLFKCGLNREIFMVTKSASVRLIWLKSEATSSCSMRCQCGVEKA
ncbi:unnamed protein product [Alopecurus aequalis]